ncbi:MAG: hypothetical protein WAN74_01605 [Thermoplasmata archaeon]
MYPALNLATVVLAFLIVIVEMTEVVALIFALQGDTGTLRHGTAGAIAGVAVVGTITVVAGALILAVPAQFVLLGSGIVLVAFGMFLFRSTLRSYRRARTPAPATSAGTTRGARSVQFGGGFTVGAVETTEAAIVLLPIAATGQGWSAVLGATLAGVLLIGLAFVLHERIRRIKVPWLKLGATSLLFAFATFWLGEVAGVPWPWGDALLVPLFLVALVLVRATLEIFLRSDAARSRGAAAT